jgi:hypothetical protein
VKAILKKAFRAIEAGCKKEFLAGLSPEEKLALARELNIDMLAMTEKLTELAHVLALSFAPALEVLAKYAQSLPSRSKP